jgi:predicted enzyme related to lactoylglutathione lyase
MCSVFVNDQAHALDWYTRVLGFVQTADQPAGDYRWIMVASPEDMQGVQLVLEPLGFAPAATFQTALKEAGIPFNSFGVADVQAEFERLSALGVHFTEPATDHPWGKSAVFDDTCGNLIGLHEVAAFG